MNIGLAVEDSAPSFERIEYAILKFGNEQNIRNPYQWFSEQLGYKSRNYFYRLIHHLGDMKIKDLKMIAFIINDESIWDMARNG